MSIVRAGSLASALVSLACVAGACTASGSGAPGPSPESDADAPSADAGAEGLSPAGTTCAERATARLEAPLPAGSELVVAWERTDGSYFVERRVETREPLAITTGSAAPPSDARVASSVPWLAIGYVVAAPVGALPAGAVAGDELRKAVIGATFEDTLVWSSGAPSGAPDGWVARVQAGYSVWTCRGSGPKSEALVESTCDALRLSIGSGSSGRFCDWQ